MGRFEKDAIALDSCHRHDRDKQSFLPIVISKFEIMEALKVIQSTQDGILRIEVPEHFKNTQLEVIIIPIVEKETPKSNHLQSIKKYFGTAKFPNTKVNKYDVYNQ